MAPDQSVRGVCPACGTALLFVGVGGYLTCSLHNCPDPTAADRLLSHSRDLRQLVPLLDVMVERQTLTGATTAREIATEALKGA